MPNSPSPSDRLSLKSVDFSEWKGAQRAPFCCPDPLDVAFSPLNSDQRSITDLLRGSQGLFDNFCRQTHVTKLGGLALSRVGEHELKRFLQGSCFVTVACFVGQHPGEGDDRIAPFRIWIASDQIGA